MLGIDLGIGVLLAENLRTGFMWEVFGRNPEVHRGMQMAGFQQNRREGRTIQEQVSVHARGRRVR